MFQCCAFTGYCIIAQWVNGVSCIIAQSAWPKILCWFELTFCGVGHLALCSVAGKVSHFSKVQA